MDCDELWVNYQSEEEPDKCLHFIYENPVIQSLKECYNFYDIFCRRFYTHYLNALDFTF